MAWLCLSCACGQKAHREEPTLLPDVDESEDEQSEANSLSLPKLPEGRMAKVGMVEIPMNRFNELYELKEKKYRDRGKEMPESAATKYRYSIASRLIYQELLRQEATALNIEINEEDLSRKAKQQRERIRDWESYKRARLESDDSLNELAKAELLEQKVLEAQGKLEVSEDDIKRYYEAHRERNTVDYERISVAQILIRTPRIDADKAANGGSDKAPQKAIAEAKAKADMAYEKLQQGVAFAEVANEFSEGGTRKNGGELGVISLAKMPEESGAAIGKLKEGETSRPFQTKWGYHIVRLYKRYPPGELPYEALENSYRQRLETRKMHEGRRYLADELEQKYGVVNEIEILMGPEKNSKKGTGNGTVGVPRNVGSRLRTGEAIEGPGAHREKASIKADLKARRLSPQ